jgi:hypothetical protein
LIIILHIWANILNKLNNQTKKINGDNKKMEPVYFRGKTNTRDASELDLGGGRWKPKIEIGSESLSVFGYPLFREMSYSGKQ